MPWGRGQQAPSALDLGDLALLLTPWDRSLRPLNRLPKIQGAVQEGRRDLIAFLADHEMPTEAARIPRKHVEAFLADLAERLSLPRGHSAQGRCRDIEASLGGVAAIAGAAWSELWSSLWWTSQRSTPGQDRSRSANDHPSEAAVVPEGGIETEALPPILGHPVTRQGRGRPDVGVELRGSTEGMRGGCPGARSSKLPGPEGDRLTAGPGR